MKLPHHNLIKFLAHIAVDQHFDELRQQGTLLNSTQQSAERLLTTQASALLCSDTSYKTQPHHPPDNAAINSKEEK
jgi:hypothetical protein